MRVRSDSRSAIAMRVASVIAGGPAPLIAAALFAHFQTGYAIAWYIAGCAVLSLISTALLPDYTNKDISQERFLSHAPS